MIYLSQDIAYGPDDTERDMVLRLRHLNTPLELRQEDSYNNAVSPHKFQLIFSKLTETMDKLDVCHGVLPAFRLCEEILL